MINAKRYERKLCIQVSNQALVGDAVRATRGKWVEKWHCIVADWTSFNCAKVLELAESFGWSGKDPVNRQELEDVAMPVILKAPELFKGLCPLPDDLAKRLNAKGEAALAEIELGYLKRPLWGHQRAAFKQLHSVTGAVLDMGMGPQPLYAKVMTPRGYVAMGDICVGDLVIGVNGKSTRVLEVHDFKDQEVYEVTFSDKSKTRCTKNHLWQVATPKQKHRNTRPRVKTLAEIMDEGLKTSSGWWRHFIPITQPVEFSSEMSRNLDPYFLGLLLGDGGLTNSVNISTPDVEVVRHIESVLPSGISIKQRSRYDYSITLDDTSGNIKGKNEILNELKRLGLFGLKSENKFIPKPYLYAPVKDRVALLQGLLDTDGFGQIDTAGIEYSTSSSELAEDFSFLVRSLGGTASMSIKKTKCLDSYRFYVKMPKEMAPFRLKRRIEKYSGNLANPTRSIRSIDFVGVEDVRCIKVENENGLYLTDDFIVTHNTGKSMLSIALIGAKKHDFGMIVCPKSVIDVWPLEFSKNCNKNFVIYTGPEKKNRSISEYVNKMQDAIRVAQAYGRPFVFVCNYEAMWQGALKEFIDANYFDYIVFDEGHRIKSHGGVASKFAAKAAERADRIICCTGTLLPHSPIDAFGIFRSVDPAIFGRQFIPFRSKFAEMGGFENKCVVRHKNLDLMHRLISSVSYRITTKDALPDLPKFKHEVRRFKMSAASRKLYNEMSSELYTEFEDNEITAANALVKGLRLMQITSGIVKDTEGVYHKIGTEKASLLADILEDIDKREPIIVFCNFTADIMAVREVAEKTGRTISELSGQLNELKDWQEGKTDVLVVQIKAGKEGVDFTRSCLCFYYSIGRSLGDYEQSLFRPNRPGQTKPGTYFHLVAEDSIDEDIYTALDERKDVVTSVLDGIKRRGERLMKKK